MTLLQTLFETLPFIISLGLIAGLIEYFYKMNTTDVSQHIKISYIAFFGKEISKFNYRLTKLLLFFISTLKYSLILTVFSVLCILIFIIWQIFFII